MPGKAGQCDALKGMVPSHGCRPRNGHPPSSSARFCATPPVSVPSLRAAPSCRPSVPPSPAGRVVGRRRRPVTGCVSRCRRAGGAPPHGFRWSAGCHAAVRSAGGSRRRHRGAGVSGGTPVLLVRRLGHERPPRVAARSRTSSSRGGSVTKGCPAPRITRGRAVPARPAGPGAAGPRHASARQRRAPRSTGAVRRGRPRSRPASGSCTGPGRRRSVTCGGRAQGCGAGRTTANGSAVPVVCRAGCRGHRLTP